MKLLLILLVLIGISPNTNLQKSSIDKEQKKMIITRKTTSKKSAWAFSYDGKQVIFFKKFSFSNKKNKERPLELNKAELVKSIYQIDSNQLKRIKSVVNNIRRCDSSLHFVIRIFKGADQTVFEEYTLESFRNCYPEEVKEIMEKLELLFEK